MLVGGPSCQDLPNSFFTGIYNSKRIAYCSKSSVAFAFDSESIRFLTGRKVQQSLQIALEATGRSGVKKFLTLQRVYQFIFSFQGALKK